MIYYLAHTVYVASCEVPEITTVDKVGAAATRADVEAGQRLVVISDGRCVPLSPGEVRMIQRKYS